jgi:hypothetical protein
VESLGLVWAFTLQENQPGLLREAQRFTQESPTGAYSATGREIQYGHSPEVDWPVADRLVRVVKSKRFASNICVASGQQKRRSRWRIDTEVFQPSPPTVTSNTRRSIKPRRWWCQVRSHGRGKCETYYECAKRIAYWSVAPTGNSG